MNLEVSVVTGELLATIPEPLRLELLAAYRQIVQNYREGRWEPSELNGGKLCEVVYTILGGYLDGPYPASAQKPTNMVDACRALEKLTQVSGARSPRIQIPRMLIALYEIRNNRGVGHVGGDVNPNHMDATCVLHMSKWVLAELVRIFHRVDTVEATAAVDSIVEKILPVIWEVNGKTRVLRTDLSMQDKTLAILYSRKDGSAAERELLGWVEHSNSSAYRRDVLRNLHAKRLLEFDEEKKLVTISPLGISHVEQSILK